MSKYHVSVLAEESIKYLITKKDGIYIDGTFGGGGHSKLILDSIYNKGKLIAIDRDIDAIQNGKILNNKYDNFILEHDNFHNIDSILKKHNIRTISGCLLDLGVSSHQIDTPERGFSFHENSFLDMRMDQANGITASEFINTISQKDLEEILYKYADEKWAKQIAKNIINYRNNKKILYTSELVQIIDDSIPKAIRYKIKGHPAKKTFQAIRIAINDEIEPLSTTIKTIVDYLEVGAHLCIITFHSIEDRVVKQTFKLLENPCTCNPKAPICTCGLKSKGKMFSKIILPSEEEIANNSRAHSAKLRIFERI